MVDAAFGIASRTATDAVAMARHRTAEPTERVPRELRWRRMVSGSAAALSRTGGDGEVKTDRECHALFNQRRSRAGVVVLCETTVLALLALAGTGGCESQLTFLPL